MKLNILLFFFSLVKASPIFNGAELSKKVSGFFGSITGARRIVGREKSPAVNIERHPVVGVQRITAALAAEKVAKEEAAKALALLEETSKELAKLKRGFGPEHIRI